MICKWLDSLVFSDKENKPGVESDNSFNVDNSVGRKRTYALLVYECECVGEYREDHMSRSHITLHFGAKVAKTKKVKLFAEKVLILSKRGCGLVKYL